MFVSVCLCVYVCMCVCMCVFVCVSVSARLRMKRGGEKGNHEIEHTEKQTDRQTESETSSERKFSIDLILISDCSPGFFLTHFTLASKLLSLAVQGSGALLSTNLEGALYKSP